MITETAFKTSAKTLNVETAAIKAVAEVESGGSGFIAGQPVILFEPHIFWKELKKVEIDPTKHLSDICYPVWGSRPYPRGQVAQYTRLSRAAEIHRGAALKSASWGKFQIMGFNYIMCGCKTLQEFINAMFRSEDEHLRLFTNYIRSAGLDDELRYKDWKGFARGYNGPLYARNRYDSKLANAYKKYSA